MITPATPRGVDLWGVYFFKKGVQGWAAYRIENDASDLITNMTFMKQTQDIVNGSWTIYRIRKLKKSADNFKTVSYN